MDLHNYKENGTVFKRTAVRAIIRRGTSYLIIHGKFGDYKFPGGGMKSGESLKATLIREVQEETGFHVIAESIGTTAFLVHEKRKGNPDDLLEMDSYYYLCDIMDKAGSRNLDDYEKEYDYQVEWLPLKTLIDKNESALNNDKIPWVQRELLVMKELLQSEAENDSVYSNGSIL